MKVLVTGGSGFIGSFLVKELLRAGEEVIIFDKKKPRFRGAEFIKGDIRDKIDLPRVNTIYHLAAQISVPFAEAYPEENYSINVEGTKHVLTYALKTKIKNFVFFSSAAVYGLQDNPIKENAIKKPINNYGLSKLKAEEECLKYKKYFSLSILRPFNVYGIGCGGVIKKFIEAAKNNKKVFIEGDGKQTRDFIHVNDVVGAALFLSDKPGVYNIGTGKETSINKLVKIIEKISCKKLEKEYIKARQADIRRSVADISALRQAGFDVKISLENGIKQIFSGL